MINKWRQDTKGCRDIMHFNNAGASLMPNVVVDAIQNYLRLEMEMGGYEAATASPQNAASFYSLAAQVLNTKSENIAFANSATDAYAKALSAIPFAKGDIILTSSNDYGSNHLAFLSMKKRLGVEVVVAEDDADGIVEVGDIQRKIKKLNPKVVAITHVPTNSGLIQPVAKIGELLKDTDIVYLVDACQSLGQLKVDVQTIHCDFLSGTFRKFLRGPRGTGLLYVSDKILEKDWSPMLIDMRGAKWTKSDGYSLKKSAKRFEYWEFSHALMAGANAALAYLLEVGIDTIAERNKLLKNYLLEKLKDTPHLVLPDTEIQQETCNIIPLYTKNRGCGELKKYLAANHINVSISEKQNALFYFEQKGMNAMLRISPHYYNTKDEIDILVACLKRL
ncbi:MAG: aminotransferase class V-fold PLP-dependent enzyme [Aureispira sp.]|nr:aminotransferase class V-fold PLP-dependent enzyme [Aureispira sp.]